MQWLFGLFGTPGTFSSLEKKKKEDSQVSVARAEAPMELYIKIKAPQMKAGSGKYLQLHRAGNFLLKAGSK